MLSITEYELSGLASDACSDHRVLFLDKIFTLTFFWYVFPLNGTIKGYRRNAKIIHQNARGTSLSAKIPPNSGGGIQSRI